MRGCEVIGGDRAEICVRSGGCDYFDLYCRHESLLKEAWTDSLWHAVPLGAIRMFKILSGGLDGCKRQGEIFTDLALQTSLVIGLFPLFLWPHGKQRQ